MAKMSMKTKLNINTKKQEHQNIHNLITNDIMASIARTLNSHGNMACRKNEDSH